MRPEPPWQQTRIIWNVDVTEPEDVPAEPDGPALLLGGLFMLAWRALGLLLFPLCLMHPRLRRHLWRLPAPEPGWIWMHGASAGEHVAGRALRQHLPAEVWPTSMSLRTPVAGAFPAPLDLPWVFEGWLDRARPRLLVLIEAELWPGWLHACHQRGIPVVVVNAKEGRGTARWRRIPALWRWLTRGVQFIPQTVTGDLKLSATFREATFSLGRDAIIAGSTRDGDEARILEAWRSLPEPRPLLVIAPRHLNRVPQVEGLLHGLKWARRSEGFSQGTEVLILDTIGELAGLYPQAKVAFVGGTFDEKLGGHSPAEALAAGLPVIRGPHTHGNPMAWSQGIVLAGDLSKALRSALALGPRAPSINASAQRAADLLPPGQTPPETWQRPWLAPIARMLMRQPSGSGVSGAIPTVVVGSLVAGGAGKTPVVGWLAEQLEGAWVVGRGYRRPGGGKEVRTQDRLGDELEMLKRRGLSVVSCPDRLAAIQAAAAEGAKLAILDDGLQHTPLRPDLKVLCIDARWPDGRGPIPVGWRRQPWSAAKGVDYLWVNHGELPDWFLEENPHLAEIPTIHARYVAKDWLIGGEPAPLDAVEGPVDVVVGIARPEGFVCQLLRLGLEVRSLRTVRDHGSLGQLAPDTVVTEKDAARLPDGADVRVLRIELEVQGAEALLDAIREIGNPANMEEFSATPRPT